MTVGEDMQLTFPVLLDAQRMSVVKDFYPYHYWFNKASMTGKYDPHYLEKIRIMDRRLKEISEKKGIYDFAPQLTNDFLGLAVIGLKNSVVRNTEGKKEALAVIRKYCEDSAVRNALRTHTMDKLPVTIRVFLLLMKARQYRICYWICKLFFKN